MMYFAYGSNLEWRQMKRRCENAQYVGRARLNGYRLTFTRLSQKRGCGVGDVVEEPNGSVWGVLYNIPNAEVGRLDKSEGFDPGQPREQNAYERRPISVDHVDDEGRVVATREAQIYVVVSKQFGLRPSSEYLRLILDGARHWRLPDDYVRQLEGIQIQENGVPEE